MPTDIIETKLGVGLNNISTVATGVFAVRFIPFVVIGVVIGLFLLATVFPWILPFLVLGTLLAPTLYRLSLSAVQKKL